jgi:molybdopterin synthase sulfur carrier subunit
MNPHRVLFFSLLQDITGTASIEWPYQPGRAVSGLLAELFQRWPSLAAWEASLLVAVDQAYARGDTVPGEGAEIALMPPVQGG